MRPLSRATLTTACLATALLTGAMPANAETLTGWTGTSGNVGGTVYLTSSAISNTPVLTATSTAWKLFGGDINPGSAAVMSRLFKSGILCEAQGYFYNAVPLPNFAISTSGGDCGPGSYNSHGLQKFYNGTSYVDHITFPSSPLDFPAPGARSADSAPSETSVNARGESLGSAEGITNDQELPDLIVANGTDGELGYVKKTDLVTQVRTIEEVLSLPQETLSDGTLALHEPARSIPLYAEDGVTQIGKFDIR